MSYIFKCKTTEAYNIKILAELLSSNIKTGCFEITADGIYLRMFDYHRKTLIDVVLNGENFNYYKYNSDKPKISVGVNLNHFFKMLRTVKKKDSLEIFIKTDEQQDLFITSIPRENTRKTTSGIKIQNIQNIEIELPTNYEKSILVNSCDFQKMCKDLNNIGSNELFISSNQRTIDFSVNAGDILKRSVCFGYNDEDEDEDDEVENKKYNAYFSMEHFFRINKITGLSSNIQIYTNGRDMPIFFKLNIGQLGKIMIFLKSKEMIESEKNNYDFE